MDENDDLDEDGKMVDTRSWDRGDWRKYYDGVLQKKPVDGTVRSRESTTMQIVCVGLGRTGSTSLALALQVLGYTVLHDDEQTDVAEEWYHFEGAEWKENADAKWSEGGIISEDELMQIMGIYGYNVTFKTQYLWAVDHPEIKSILTVRDDPDAYVDSWLNAVPYVDYMKQRPFRWMGVVQQMMPEIEGEYKGETTGWHPEDYKNREKLRSGYTKHIADVQAAIPADRLLTYNVKEGWEPLCKYLGKPIPAVPFPHTHDKVKLAGEMFVLWFVTWTWPLFLACPAVSCWLLIRTHIIPSLNKKRTRWPRSNERKQKAGLEKFGR